MSLEIRLKSLKISQILEIMNSLTDSKEYQNECNRIRSLIDLYRGEVLYSIGKLIEPKPTLSSDEERGWRDHALFHLGHLFDFLMTESGYCSRVRYNVQSNEHLRGFIKCDECNAQTAFDQLKDEYMKTLKLAGTQIRDIPNMERMLIALSLPDHLRLTYNTLCGFEQATATEVSGITRRARAVESGYLNQLEGRGGVGKKRVGRKTIFWAKIR